MKHQRAIVGVLVFVVAFAYVWWMASDVFNLGIDEGIYLEGGLRVAHGQAPYRDFFTITGPLTFWVQGALARAGGGNIVWMRIPMVLDVAFLVWAVFWLASYFEGLAFSSGLAATFLVYTARLNRLVVNHRWDSAALGVAAIVLAFAAQRKNCRWLWLAAGVAAAAGASATPSMALVAIPLAVWSWRGGRGNLVAFGGGLALAGAAVLATLAAGGALGGFFDTMRWVPANYLPANRVPYGRLLGQVRFGNSWSTIPLFFVQVIYTMLPAMLPVLALGGWLVLWWRRPKERTAELIFLLAATGALVLSAWPRWSVEQLHFPLAAIWVVSGLLLNRLLPVWLRRAFFIPILCLTVWAGVNRLLPSSEYRKIATRAGVLRGDRGDEDYLRGFEWHIAKGQSMFVFPYLPALYVLLGGSNPTPYPFLQPGMMTEADEQRTLAALQANPPQWVIVADIPADVVMSVWPGSDPQRIAMRTLRQYIKDKYLAMDIVQGKWGSAILMKREQ